MTQLEESMDCAVAGLEPSSVVARLAGSGAELRVRRAAMAEALAAAASCCSVHGIRTRSHSGNLFLRRQQQLKIQSRLTIKGQNDRRQDDGLEVDRTLVVSGGLGDGVSRREALNISGSGLLGLLLSMGLQPVERASANQFADMPALRGKDYGKSKMRFPDYVETSSGLQYKDLREGVGPPPEQGDVVMVDWAGYTIGYYGRIFEARNKAKGGSFEGSERDYFKFRVGGDEVIPAFEEAIKTMRVGGVRRVIVPPELGYPNNDYNTKGPKPATFSGQRALDFVLKNQGLIDKTLLFDIELLKVNKNK
ncbi:hypothetical protein AXG93_2899s1200 [Marchantia polymorpha subsp. ruderalis]|uniref:peptidylprolyl isomerase n=3 Tax=Marchantia polymorpha TaxID=3197 RepID=A0A176VCR8_MARPO|nr:hypothetical protein AXG93_2899s1200 [Marchantia polymorpha subsp. ruderalis]